MLAIGWHVVKILGGFIPLGSGKPKCSDPKYPRKMRCKKICTTKVDLQRCQCQCRAYVKKGNNKLSIKGILFTKNTSNSLRSSNLFFLPKIAICLSQTLPCFKFHVDDLLPGCGTSVSGLPESVVTGVGYPKSELLLLDDSG